MNKILAFGASNSKKSINKKLANFTANKIKDAAVTLIDLNDFEMPIYSIDVENEHGIPEKAQSFKKLIETHDGIVLSMAEHNGAYTAAFKNIMDWASRLEGALWNKKPMLLLSSSPGKRGGASVMELASVRFPRMGADIVAKFSLPSFNQNFSEQKGISEPALSNEFEAQLKVFQAQLEKEVAV